MPLFFCQLTASCASDAQEQLLLVERDLGAMQTEALELRGAARSREAEAAELRGRVAEQTKQVLTSASSCMHIHAASNALRAGEHDGTRGPRAQGPSACQHSRPFHHGRS